MCGVDSSRRVSACSSRLNARPMRRCGFGTSPRGKAFVTKVRGSRTGIPTADSTAVHDNETAALSLFE